jgi:hypothetical protein
MSRFNKKILFFLVLALFSYSQAFILGGYLFGYNPGKDYSSLRRSGLTISFLAFDKFEGFFNYTFFTLRTDAQNYEILFRSKEVSNLFERSIIRSMEKQTRNAKFMRKSISYLFCQKNFEALPKFPDRVNSVQIALYSLDRKVLLNTYEQACNE